MPRFLFVLALLTVIPVQAQPVPDMPRVSVFEAAAIPQTDDQHPIRIKLNPADDQLYVLTTSGRLYRLDSNGTAGGFDPIEVIGPDDHGTPEPVGMTFGADGTLYLLGNEDVGSTQTRFVLRKGSVSAGAVWSTVALSEGYLLSHTWFDHKANGLALSPDETTLYINSGARTDHGESYGGVREEGLTAIVLQVPAASVDLTLPNDREALRNGGYIFAEGIRNSFDLEFSPAGDLMAADNAGDRDDSEEFNWIREGHHYGFPWRIGTSETPMQHPGYDPSADPFVQPDRNTNNTADTGWYFSNDPNYPAPPSGVTFTDPIPNQGPFADQFRMPGTGAVTDASEVSMTVGSFTAHRSPLGLVFDSDSVLTDPLRGGAFVVSWNSSDDQLLSRLGGTGEDLLFLDLDKSTGDYTMTVERVAHGFDHPIDAEMVGSTIYVLEYGTPWAPGGSRAVQAVTLRSSTAVAPPASASLLRVGAYPNPSRGYVQIDYEGALGRTRATLEIVDMLGRVVYTSRVAGRGSVQAGDGLPSGVYLVRIGEASHWASSLFTVTR